MNSDKMTVENVGLKNKLLNRVGQVALSLVSSVLVLVTAGAPAGAIDAAETAIASEGGKGVLIQDPMLGTSFEKILKIYYYNLPEEYIKISWFYNKMINIKSNARN